MNCKKLKKIMKAQKVTQATLANDVGVAQGFFSRIIGGHKQPSLATFKRICERLNVKPEELW